MPQRLAVCLALLTLAAPVRGAQPQFWKIEGARDFLEGDTEGLSVDSEGRVRLSPSSRVLHDPEVPAVWCIAPDAKGVLYAGTGNDGKVFRIDDGKGALVFDAPELEVHALVVGPDGRLYVGTSPEGKVYAVDAKGKAEPFYDPADKYIWALAFDPQGNLLVATGAEGRIHRVDKQGKAQILFTTMETHLTALTVDEMGRLYAGSSPGGIVYRIDPSGKVFVLYDSPYREVKALDTGADGSVYVGAIDGQEKEEGPRPPFPVTPLLAAAPVGEVTVTEAYTVIPQATAPPPPPTPPRGVEPPRPGAAKGAVLRILPLGEVETLWSSAEDVPHSLVGTGDGVLVGTGDKGKLYRVRDDRTWTMVATFPAGQVTGLHKGPGGSVALATSNPGKVYALEGTPGSRGTFTSKVKDTDTASTWGRLRWEATVPSGTEVRIQTRSGNTGTPDSTWSDWSAPYTRRDGDPVTSERARFLQARAVLEGKNGTSPVLDTVSAAYLQRNLRSQVQSITVHPPGEIFQKPISITGEIEILGLEPGESQETRPGAPSLKSAFPPATAYSRRLYQKGIQTFTWKAEDPNGDTLVYDIHCRQVDDTRYRLLRKGLADAVLAWDTSTVPNGRYVIRVTASDSPSNPDALALTGEKESAPFEVDNTPPTVTATLARTSPMRVRATVRDENSLIRRAEYSVDGGRWQEVHPIDGINDALEEVYEFGPELPAGPHIVVVRAMDLLGNVSTARVEVK